MNKRHGFTLIELLVVIAIISLLISILLPSLNKAKDLARSAVCMVNLRQIGTAVQMYIQDNNDNYPRGSQVDGVHIQTVIDPLDGIPKSMGAVPKGINPPLHVVYTGTVLSQYIDQNLKIFLCPGNSSSLSGWTSYGYNGAYLGGHTSGGGGSMATGPCVIAASLTNPAGTVAIVESVADDIRPPSGYGGGYLWFMYSYEIHNEGMNVLLCDGHVQWFSIDNEDLNATDDRMWKGY